MRRYLCIWFPDWPLDRLRRARLIGRPRSSAAAPVKPRPFVLSERTQRGLIIVAANSVARAAGIEPGLGLADARARISGLSVEEIDREADAKALLALAHWMGRFSPRVMCEDEDGLCLETSGCDHLFGGEAAMLAAISGRLSAAGYVHRLGLAGTRGAAFALAHAAAAQDAPAILPPGGERAGLAPLPAESLRLSPDAVQLLRRFGLTRIGDLYRIDRKALARRFQSREIAGAVCLRLDQALGLACEPIRPVHPPSEHVVDLQCPDPLTDAAGIREGLSRLTVSLCGRLSQAGLGAQDFHFLAFRSDGEVSRISVAAARPVRSPAHVLRLFRERIDRIDPGYGVDLLRLEAFRTGALEISSGALSPDLAGGAAGVEAVAALVDRINARLGEARVTVAWPQARHSPEKAWRRQPFTGEFPAQPGSEGSSLRPLCWLRAPERIDVIAEVPDGPPLRFLWRRRPHQVVRSDGPERIGPEWWEFIPSQQCPDHPETDSIRLKSRPRTRDYYRIEDGEGRRYWVFRDGLYGDERSGPPCWYMQGFFA